jgi:hypothetical protein
MQVFGGFAFAREYGIERKWREARLYQTAPISKNMILRLSRPACAGPAAQLLTACDWAVKRYSPLGKRFPSSSTFRSM